MAGEVPGAGERDPRTFPCPGCAATLAAGSRHCPHCDIRLVGDDAARLWTVNQQLAALHAEADRLLESMRGPAPAAEAPAPPGPGGSMTAGVAPMPPAAPHGAGARPRGPSGQGVLLTVGGVLLLCGAAAFVVVVWLLVGVYGQALLMAGATVAAALVARALGRRGLAAGAETFAVIACGLVLLDLWGAHHLGFAGLGDVQGAWYAAPAAVLGAACAVVADRATRPRRFAYAPFAALLATVAPWPVVVALDLVLVPLVAAVAVAFLLDVVVLTAILRSARRMSPPAVVAAAVTGLGLVAFVLLDLGLGFDTTRSRTVHLAAAALALVVPALVLAARAVRWPAPAVADAVRVPAPWLVAAFVGAAFGMVVFDAPLGVVVAVAAALAVLVVAGAAWSVHPPVRVVAGVAAVGQGLLAFWVAIDPAGLWTGAAAPVHALPALLWALAAIVRALTDRAVSWVVVAEVAVGLTVARGFADAARGTTVLVSGCLLVANGILGGVAARRPHRDPARGTATPARGIEIVAVLAGAAWAVATVGASLALDDRTWTAMAFWVVGAVAVAHAGAPGRLAFGYPGAVSLALGAWVLLEAGEVGTVEAYSLPLAAMLAVLGLVQARRHPRPPTLLTAGPALAIALLPSLVAAVHTGSVLRMVSVTAAGAVVLLAGLQRRWLAPVLAGILTLAVVAVTRGGPLLAYVPSWLTLTVVGALLLTAGVRWEASVRAGRRAGVWLGSLR